MIVELQVYEMQVGKASLLVDAYRDRGLQILKRHLGDFAGMWIVDLGGDLDDLYQVWTFADHADRARRREELANDSDWAAFAGEFGHLIRRRRMRVLRQVEL